MINYLFAPFGNTLNDRWLLPRNSSDGPYDNILIRYLVVGQRVVCLGRAGPDLTSQNAKVLEQHLLDTQQLWELRSPTKMLAILKMFPGLTMHLLHFTRLTFSMHRTPLTHLMNKELSNLHLQKRGLVLLSKVTLISPWPPKEAGSCCFPLFLFQSI